MENPMHTAGINGEYDSGREKEEIVCPGCHLPALSDEIYCPICYEMRQQINRPICKSCNGEGGQTKWNAKSPDTDLEVCDECDGTGRVAQ